MNNPSTDDTKALPATRVLLIEDDPGDVVVIGEILNQALLTRFEITSAASLEEGLDCWETGAFDIILLDVWLPDSEGEETFVRCRSRAEKVPIIVLTRIEDDELAGRLIERGASDYLVTAQIDSALIERSIRFAILRKELSDELTASREMYSRLINSSPALLYKLIVEGDRLVPFWMTPRQYEELGYEPVDAFTFEWWVAQIHPSDREEAMARMKSLLDNDYLVHEYRMRRMDGSYVWLRDESKVYRDEHGVPTEVIGTWADITRLKESEATYRTLYEDSPISVWEEDFSALKAYVDELREAGITEFRDYFEAHPDAVSHCVGLVKILGVNRATLRLYKADDKQALYDGLENVFTDASIEVFREELIALCEGKTRFESVMPARDLRGNPLLNEITLVIVPGYEETWSRVFLSDVDVTKRGPVEPPP